MKLAVITYGSDQSKITYSVHVEDAVAFFKSRYPTVTIHKVTGYKRDGSYIA